MGGRVPCKFQETRGKCVWPHFHQEIMDLKLKMGTRHKKVLIY